MLTCAFLTEIFFRIDFECKNEKWKKIQTKHKVNQYRRTKTYSGIDRQTDRQTDLNFNKKPYKNRLMNHKKIQKK